jgi:L-ribulose-5-phosphate 3-epimerase
MNLINKSGSVPIPSPFVLRTLSLLILTLIWLTAAPSPARAAQDKKAEVRFGVCDWTIGKPGDPAAFTAAHKLGLDGIQVSLVPAGDSLYLVPLDLQKKYLLWSATNRLAICSFAIGELNNVPLKSDPLAEKWLGQAIDISSSMQVRRILVPFFGKGDLRNDPQGTAAVIASLKRLAPKAEKQHVILALESWLSAEAHVKILDAVGSKAVRVYYDVGNAHDAGYDVPREVRFLGSRICEIHAKDNKDLYGKGAVDFAAVKKAMDDIGYRGWLVIEGSKFPLGVEPSIAYDLNYLKTVFRLQ